MGQSDKRFSQDVDNYMNIGEVYNMMIAPLLDNKGVFRGIIHLVNKEVNSSGLTTITEDDRKEFQGMLNVIGEIIRTADESSEVTELCCCK